MLGTARFVYASLARVTVIKFVHYMNASADVLALASIEVPIENIPSGGCIIVKYGPFPHLPPYSSLCTVLLSVLHPQKCKRIPSGRYTMMGKTIRSFP